MDDSPPQTPSPVVLWVDKGRAFETHLAPAIEALRKIATVETFIDSASALKLMAKTMKYCQNGENETDRKRIACVITNMQRRTPTSGLTLLGAMKAIFPTNVLSHEYNSFPPTIVYSAGTLKNPDLMSACKALGAMLVLADDINEVQRIITETISPTVSLNFLINPLFEQRDKLETISERIESQESQTSQITSLNQSPPLQRPPKSSKWKWLKTGSTAPETDSPPRGSVPSLKPSPPQQHSTNPFGSNVTEDDINGKKADGSERRPSIPLSLFIPRSAQRDSIKTSEGGSVEHVILFVF